jgi:hypothetical protein
MSTVVAKEARMLTVGRICSGPRSLVTPLALLALVALALAAHHLAFLGVSHAATPLLLALGLASVAVSDRRRHR